MKCLQRVDKMTIMARIHDKYFYFLYVTSWQAECTLAGIHVRKCRGFRHRSHQTLFSVQIINNDFDGPFRAADSNCRTSHTYVSIVSQVLLLSSAPVTNVSAKCVCVLMNRDGALR